MSGTPHCKLFFHHLFYFFQASSLHNVFPKRYSYTVFVFSRSFCLMGISGREVRVQGSQAQSHFNTSHPLNYYIVRLVSSLNLQHNVSHTTNLNGILPLPCERKSKRHLRSRCQPLPFRGYRPYFRLRCYHVQLGSPASKGF